MNRILLVEVDTQKAADTVEKLRVRREYFVEFCGSSAAALSALGGRHGYRAIIASYEMPKVSGIELIRKIRGFDKRVGIVVLADDPEKAENECHGLDVMGVVDRKSGNGHLLEMVGQAIEITEMPQEELDDIETSLHTQTLALDDLPGTLDAPPIAP